MNRLLGITTLSLSLAFASVAAGCGGSTAVPGPAATADVAATKAPLNAVVHGHIKLAAAALADVPLRADQRAQIETLATNADTLHVAVRTARHVSCSRSRPRSPPVKSTRPPSCPRSSHRHRRPRGPDR